METTTDKLVFKLKELDELRGREALLPQNLPDHLLAEINRFSEHTLLKAMGQQDPFINLFQGPQQTPSTTDNEDEGEVFLYLVLCLANLNHRKDCLEIPLKELDERIAAFKWIYAIESLRREMIRERPGSCKFIPALTVRTIFNKNLKLWFDS